MSDHYKHRYYEHRISELEMLLCEAENEIKETKKETKLHEKFMLELAQDYFKNQKKECELTLLKKQIKSCHRNFIIELLEEQESECAKQCDTWNDSGDQGACYAHKVEPLTNLIKLLKDSQ
tara:strand:- start:30667 stop:31029 length:363 start_codon:yes stop_codon:yes gene_type:complete